ncbi:MAG: hypothetical protein AVDCRST_MAG77-2409 [uncultured Chloroflexi bacterium]|uniref:Uncharacterized protein n=1 Tax=uncultured Chloroflexota bacterium TaxID=166587 RepID=A0A6J4IRK8_9CHLR|nr:MAG: hypothetical protein AVDCRST_MAG77-2409 [uncultured Chloroflexota bacterium]
MAALAAAIDAEIRDWEDPAVERAIFGTRAPDAIAVAFDTFCAEHLGSRMEAPLFYSSSMGAVAGVRLADGRCVVIKAHQPDQSAAFLSAVQRVQRHLAARAFPFPCPRPLLGPVPVGGGHATVEEYDAGGEYRDAHEPPVRRALARTLARLAEDARPFAGDPALLAAGRACRPPADRLWGKPHSVIFDFEATAAGAEWIDDIARRARQLLEELERDGGAGDVVVGHNDWSMRQMRLAGDTVRVVYDWDSLIAEREPVVVGRAARGFTMTYGTPLDGTVPVAPALVELLSFAREYEAGRGRPFTPGEWRTMGAAAAHGLAYTSRCGHARAPLDGPNAVFPAGSYREALARYGEDLLAPGDRAVWAFRK